MNLWERIKNGLDEGLETFSEKSSEISLLVQLKWERRNIQKEIQQELTALGDLVYRLQAEKKQSELEKSGGQKIEALKSLEQKLQNKEKEIEEASAKIDRKQVKGLKKDLEMGDGTIEQIVIDEKSAMADKKLMEIKFPKQVLVGTIVRKEKVIIPDGNTVIQAGDKVTLLGKKADVESALAKFSI